jgi:hypothetical protein
MDDVRSIESRRTMERGKVKVKEAAVVKTVKMLMLVPRKETFDLLWSVKVELWKTAKKCYLSESELFRIWASEGTNNTDFLYEKGFVPSCGESFVKCRNERGMTVKEMNRANMMMAFLTARKLCQEDKFVLHFTYVDNFTRCLSQKDELCSVVSEHFNMILLCPSGDIRELGAEGNAQVQELHQFCALDLLKCHVLTYPPLSLAFVFEDKLERDSVFQEFMLPFVYLKVKTSLAKTAKIAAENLENEYPGNAIVADMAKFGMVAKMSNNHSALGVYFLQPSKRSKNRWKQSCKKKDSSFARGTIMHFEPLVVELKHAEMRIYASLDSPNSVCFNNKVITSTGLNDEITLENPPTPFQQVKEHKAAKELVRSAYKVLLARFPHWNRLIKNVTL